MGVKKSTQVLAVASIFAFFTGKFAGFALMHYNQGGSLLFILLHTLLATVFLLATVICLDIWRLNPANSHTLRSLYSQYKFIMLHRLRRPHITRLIIQKTLDAKKTSEETLMRILAENKSTDYGRRHNLASIKCREDFIQQMPITTYEDYRGYVDRIVEHAETDVIHPGATQFLVGTSGTTGKAKIYPFSQRLLQDGAFVMGHVHPQMYADLLTLGRFFKFHLFSDIKVSPGGIKMAPASQLFASFPAHNLIPKEYGRLTLEDHSYYAQALFALAERELIYISGFSSDLMFAFWKFIIAHWENFCKDIERGDIGSEINMPESIRKDLSAQLKPDPARAADLREAIKEGTFGIARRVWKDMRFLTMGTSAGFKLCADALLDEHLKGIRVFDLDHAATEGMLGMNFRQLTSEDDGGFILVLWPSSFTEFIPLEKVEEDQPETVMPENVEVGKLYEIVHTNCYGLYRNRFGDIIKIVGFFNGTPKYRIMYKLGQRLNIAYERTPDQFLIEAIDQETKNLPSGARLVNFTSVESIVTDKLMGVSTKGHYVFFVEFSHDLKEDCKELAKKLDVTLGNMYEQYKLYRTSYSIGPLEVFQVKCGTFDCLRSYIWHDPHGQFKMPRVLRRKPALKFLLNQIIVA